MLNVEATRRRAPKPVQVLRVIGFNAAPFLVAVSRSEPGTAYLLDADRDGRWRCPCPAFGFRGDCAHVAQASRFVAERRAA